MSDEKRGRGMFSYQFDKVGKTFSITDCPSDWPESDEVLVMHISLIPELIATLRMIQEDTK